ncbi:MAG TPA: hypothetical protein VGJ84_18665 [Polyangiaceae bacterium]|jgi:hypothetical protein
MIDLWPLSAKFFQELLRIDGQAVSEAQRSGCRHCQGRLDRADYPRKVRGLPAGVEEHFGKRFSLCCCRDGCRKRLTPASVRFLGRRVYAGALVLVASMVCLLVGKPEPLFGVPALTIGRWSTWWRSALRQTAFWKVARVRLLPAVDEALLPTSLLERFSTGDRPSARGDPEPICEQALLSALSFLRPVTTSSGLPMAR